MSRRRSRRRSRRSRRRSRSEEPQQPSLGQTHNTSIWWSVSVCRAAVHTRQERVSRKQGVAQPGNMKEGKEVGRPERMQEEVWASVLVFVLFSTESGGGGGGGGGGRGDTDVQLLVESNARRSRGSPLELQSLKDHPESEIWSLCSRVGNRTEPELKFQFRKKMEIKDLVKEEVVEEEEEEEEGAGLEGQWEGLVSPSDPERLLSNSELRSEPGMSAAGPPLFVRSIIR
ncbi:unnamed protein product [Pleuronectes platessa]|uniref:Uncharacterized protein n=1 Tax=Pleuronectes platessa TaxID=8262 RepID=A0A9N7TN56_PLEPL|nr:unnamed protein product [Pleuronectes platessa]